MRNNNQSVKSTYPLVSVLTPIYNTTPAHLRECIESILHQTFTDFEFLILNDSPNNTEIENIVKSYKDTRIKYHKNDTNIGISASRNKLLKMARGKYLAIFDHDDISVPTRLAQEVEYLDSNPDIGVVGCQMLWFPKNAITDFPINNLDIKRKLIDSCAIPHTASMIRKSVMIDNNIQWEAQYSPAEDYMLWIRLIDKTMFHNLPDVLVKYRYFDGNTTHRQMGKMLDRDMIIRAYAHTNYGFFLSKKAKPILKRWIRLFCVIPFIRITTGRNEKVKMYLFGFIPLFSLIFVFKTENTNAENKR